MCFQMVRLPKKGTTHKGSRRKEWCICPYGKTADRKPELETCLKKKEGWLCKHSADVEDALFVPMLGRIYASEHCPQILYDRKTLELKNRLPSDLIKQNMQNQYTLLASASRSANMDWFIGSFLERRPDGVIVQLGCGLETTYHRCDNGKTHWYAVDLPHVIEYQRGLLPEPEGELSVPGMPLQRIGSKKFAMMFFYVDSAEELAAKIGGNVKVIAEEPYYR